jgi:peptidyl-tRNA hydrolase, PTH1 family
LLFIGLGNPGTEYHGTRHNAGFMVIDKLAETFLLKFKKPFFKNYYLAKGFYNNKKVILIKPLTYMNRSGLILESIPDKYIQPEYPIVVICDNMDLATGECRIKTKGSGSSHNGISSIIQSYGSEDFTRIYVGISRPDKRESIISYVLGRPVEDDFIRFENGIKRACSAALSLLTNNIQRVMSEYNRKQN